MALSPVVENFLPVHEAEDIVMFSTPRAFNLLQSGSPLSTETKQVILNVYCRVREDSELPIGVAVAEASRLTGISVTTIYRIKAEYKANGKPRSPVRLSHDVARKKARRTICSELDSFTREGIRRKVHAFFSSNEIPTVELILAKLREDQDFKLPQMGITTLTGIIKSLGFEFKSRKRDSAMITRTDLISWRWKYLREIQEFRAAGKPIYFLDETWVNAGHTKKKVWVDNTVQSAEQAFTSGLTVGLTAPSGKGSRLIITHAGNEDGFVPGALDVFTGRKSGDYHDEMDGNHFKRWCAERLLPNIKPNSVIVMDNASYHSVRVEQLPTSKTRKADIQAWLSSKGVKRDSKMLVRDLLQLVNIARSKYLVYAIDKMCEDAGHKVLRLPPYHCELNPIELIWANVKGYVSRRNRTFKLADVKKLLEEGIAQVTVEDWANAVKHVINKEEPRFIGRDGFLTAPITPFIITTEGDSNTESESSDSEV